MFVWQFWANQERFIYRILIKWVESIQANCPTFCPPSHCRLQFLPFSYVLEAFILVVTFLHPSDVNQVRSQDREAQELDSHLNNHVLVSLCLFNRSYQTSMYDMCVCVYFQKCVCVYFQKLKIILQQFFICFMNEIPWMEGFYNILFVGSVGFWSCVYIWFI